MSRSDRIPPYPSINFIERCDDLLSYWMFLFIVVDRICMRALSPSLSQSLLSIFLSIFLSLSHPYSASSFVQWWSVVGAIDFKIRRRMACAPSPPPVVPLPPPSHRPALPFQSVPSLRWNRRPSTGTWSRRSSQPALPSGDRQLSLAKRNDGVSRDGDVPQGVKRVPRYVTPR